MFARMVGLRWMAGLLLDSDRFVPRTHRSVVVRPVQFIYMMARCSARLRRVASSGLQRVRVAAEDAVRQNVQTGDYDRKLVHRSVRQSRCTAQVGNCLGAVRSRELSVHARPACISCLAQRGHERFQTSYFCAVEVWLSC